VAAPRSLTERLLARLGELTNSELDEIARRSLALAADRGNAGARHCAAVLGGLRQGGAPPIDDAQLLAEVDALVLAGRGPAAIGIVARKNGATEAKIDAIARRLRRKRSDKKNGQNSSVRAGEPIKVES